MKRFRCRIAAVLVLVLSTAAAAAQAAGRPVAWPERAGFLEAAWTWIISHTLPAAPPGRTVVEKAGCEMDPNGLLRCSPISPSAEAGCEMDPDGVR